MGENVNLREYYKNLLIMQYRDKPKALAHIGALVDVAMIYDVAVQVRDGFDVNTAVGAQQDILSKYLGTNRTITGTTFTRNYYGYSKYGDTAPFTFYPMLKYGDAAPDVQFRNYDESIQSLYELNDEELRIIQKLAIVRNNSNASVKDIDDILFELFGADCYFIDRMNMTVVSYMVGERWSRMFQIAKSEGLLPNPAGVGTSLIVVPDIQNIFGYSLYGGEAPAFAKGYADYFGKWTEVGSPITLSGADFSSITALSSSRIAFINNVDKRLLVYDFNDSTWTQIGNPLEILGSSVQKIAALSSSRIAFVDEFYKKLKTYDFDGTNWTAIGNEMSIFNVQGAALTALSSSRVAYIDRANKELWAFNFDGTDWITVGSSLLIPGIGPPTITALSSSRIALVDATRRILETYDFDGTDWTLTGTGINVGGLNYISISTLSSSKIVLANNGETITNYEFDGETWYEIGESKEFENPGFPSVAALSGSEIAFLTGYNQSLQTYDMMKKIIGCMASYSL